VINDRMAIDQINDAFPSPACRLEWTKVLKTPENIVWWSL